MQHTEQVDSPLFETDGEDYLNEVEPLYEVNRKTRFLNYVLDFAGFYAFAFVSGIVLYLLGLEFLIVSINETILGILVMLTYYCLFESMFGQTIGKMITGSVVVTEDGNKPSFVDILKRTLSRFIPFEAFTFLGSDVGLHDRLSKTRVVKKVKN
ncbi:RDD family protein [Pontibacter sp. MBLB2868]|uniref:RDD family protein n=1 Tax=Pontibacter sp. MBLB2868 TaxID=3451555 RepID=UPI003F74EE61